MDLERFQRMVGAYGADPARWPIALRADGLWFLAQAPEGEQLAEAERALDAQLDAWTMEPPGLPLHDRIVALEPRGRVVRSRWRSKRLWLSGAGLAAACAAGVLVGVNVGAAGTLPGLRSGDHDAEALAASLEGVAVFGSRLDPEASL